MMSGCFVPGHRWSSVCREAVRCRRYRHIDGTSVACNTPPAEVPLLSNAITIVTASRFTFVEGCSRVVLVAE
eukprot:scaffold129549_cov41-Prasinocladus_malaysianus.AAC.1